MSDIRAALLEALGKRDPLAEERRARSARTPDQNNPWRPEARRPERRTQRSYADPTGETAIGNRKRNR